MAPTRFSEARRAIALHGPVAVATTLVHNQRQDGYHLAAAIRAELERGTIRPEDADHALELLGRPNVPCQKRDCEPCRAARVAVEAAADDRERNTPEGDVHELVAEIADVDARVHSHARRLEVLEVGRERLEIMCEKAKAETATVLDRLAQLEHQVHGRIGELANATAEIVDAIGDPAAEAAYLNAVVEGAEPVPSLPEDRELGVSAFGFAGGVRQATDERRERADTGTVRGL
jgi:hypothetical protein